MTTVPSLVDEAALNQYTATGGQTDFNFTYMIFATADIKVYVNGVLKTEITDYNVRKSGGGVINSPDLPLDGGKVVFVAGLTASDEVTLTRDISIDRITQYTVAGAFRADVLNAELTRILAICQQLRRDLERSISLAPFDSEGGDLTLPTGRASTFLGFDASGNITLLAGDTDTTVVVSPFMETVLDDLTASAALTTLGFSTFIKTLIDDADAATARTTLGAQTLNSNLTALAGLTFANNKLLALNGSGVLVLRDRDASDTNAGIVELATNAETATGADTVRAITPAALLSLFPTNSFVDAGGYAQIPVKIGGVVSKMIIQWGISGSLGGGGNSTITLPIAFPSGGMCAGVVGTNYTGSAESNNTVANLTTTQIQIRTGSTTSQVYRWFAIGH